MVISWKGFTENINGLKSIIEKKDGNAMTLKMNISFFKEKLISLSMILETF